MTSGDPAHRGVKGAGSIHHVTRSPSPSSWPGWEIRARCARFFLQRCARQATTNPTGRRGCSRSSTAGGKPPGRHSPDAPVRSRHRGDARDDEDPRPPTTPGSYTTPGALVTPTGTPRKSRPAGSRTSKPSGATRHKSHANRHIPRNSKALGAGPQTGLKYPERPRSGS